MTVRLIVFTLAALSLVNAYSFVRLYSSTYISTVRVMKDSSPLRTPAAIPPEQPVVVAKSLNSRIAHDLNCGSGKKMTGHLVKGSWFQLKGRLCKSNKVKSVEITNLSNGYTASIFNSGTQDYQTDLIQLNEGDNKIRVRVTPVKGDVEEQTVIINGQPI